jgi:hypothetical protein
MSMATYAKYSPIKYSSAFSSNVPRDLKPRSTTAEWVGPGAYPGVEKLPVSPFGKFNINERGLGHKIEQNDTREVGTGFKFFSEENSAGIQFKLAGIERDSRAKLLITKLYPRLATKVYRSKITGKASVTSTKI